MLCPPWPFYHLLGELSTDELPPAEPFEDMLVRYLKIGLSDMLISEEKQPNKLHKHYITLQIGQLKFTTFVKCICVDQAFTP